MDEDLASCDTKVLLKLKRKFYRTTVRSAMLYETKCWAVKNKHENKISVTEIRMMHLMCDKARWNKIRNDSIRERVGVAPILQKMVENRFK